MQASAAGDAVSTKELTQSLGWKLTEVNTADVSSAKWKRYLILVDKMLSCSTECAVICQQLHVVSQYLSAYGQVAVTARFLGSFTHLLE
jgi:hypothetical protein